MEAVPYSFSGYPMVNNLRLSVAATAEVDFLIDLKKWDTDY